MFVLALLRTPPTSIPHEVIVEEVPEDEDGHLTNGSLKSLPACTVPRCSLPFRSAARRPALMEMAYTQRAPCADALQSAQQLRRRPHQRCASTAGKRAWRLKRRRCASSASTSPPSMAVTRLPRWWCSPTGKSRQEPVPSVQDPHGDRTRRTTSP